MGHRFRQIPPRPEPSPGELMTLREQYLQLADEARANGNFGAAVRALECAAEVDEQRRALRPVRRIAASDPLSALEEPMVLEEES